MPPSRIICATRPASIYGSQRSTSGFNRARDESISYLSPTSVRIRAMPGSRAIQRIRIRFLLDENGSKALLEAIRQQDPNIDIVRVGEPGAPSTRKLSDPDILRYCESVQRMLLTRNRESMPTHIADHFAAGHHHWGVFRLRPGYGITAYATAVHLLFAASEAEEWIDRDVVSPMVARPPEALASSESAKAGFCGRQAAAARIHSPIPSHARDTLARLSMMIL